MIYTDFTDLKRYKGMSVFMDKAINFLSENKIDLLEMGRNTIDGDNVYVNRFDYETLEEKDCFYEAHAEYIDIHILLSGEEQIAVSDTDSMEEVKRDLSADFIEYAGDAQARFAMTPAKILIVYPKEAHMVKIRLHGAGQVRKAVCKVRDA